MEEETIVIKKKDWERNQQIFASTHQAYQDMVKISQDMDKCLREILIVNQKIFNNKDCKSCLKIGNPSLIPEHEDAMKMIAFMTGAVNDLGGIVEEDIKWALEYKDRCVECNTIGSTNCSDPDH